MTINSSDQNRQSTRLQGFDYTQPGAYFVTICAWQRDVLFGEVIDGKMRLSPAGKIAASEWQRLKYHFSNLEMGTFVVMPNHVHGILIITEPVGAIPPAPEGAQSGEGGGEERATSSKTGSPRVPGETPVWVGRATLDSADQAHSGGDAVPTSLADGLGGSPLREARSGSGVGATHPAPEEARSGEGGGEGCAMSGKTGSPRSPGEVPGWMRRATLDSADQARSGDDAVPDGATDGFGGSPLRGARVNGPAPGSLGAMVGQLKSRATRRIWALPGNERTPIWQRNYYEHIIRDEDEWRRIREYITANPMCWADDQLHPAAPPNRFNQE